jgi:cysteine desulfurase
VISSIEHPSITAPAEHLERLGWTVHRLPAHCSGEVDTNTLPPLLNDRTKLVSVMLANNETGVLQPVAEIAALCRARSIPLHTDAVQVAGKLPLDFRQLDVSALTVAAHKFHGPLGIGALLVRHEVTLHPLLLGGFQQEGYRGGTESVALAVGMRAALVAWEQEHEARRQRMFDLRARFEAQLGQTFGPRLVVIGRDTERLPHTSNVAILGIDRQALVIALDLAGVACSSGSACASGSSEPSPVLLAMGCNQAVIDSAVRFSLGANTSPAEIDGAVQKIVQVVEQMSAKRVEKPS